MKTLDIVAFVILLIGGINWGLVGLFQMDIVGAVFGFMSPATRVCYTLIGLSALLLIIQWKAVYPRIKRK